MTENCLFLGYIRKFTRTSSYKELVSFGIDSKVAFEVTHLLLNIIEVYFKFDAVS